MRICVTGGAGFIGSEIVKQLIELNHEVIVVDLLTYAGDLNNLKDILGRYDFYQTDIRDKVSLENVFEKEQVDLVIHAAAETHVDNSIRNPEIFIESNITGTFNLLEIARKKSIKFLQVSTDEVYGSRISGAFSEDDILNPSSPYSASKASAEMLVMSYVSTFNLNALIVRCSNNYGPRQFPEKLIPTIISRLISNKTVPIYGNGLNIREWIHVSDSARAIIEVALNGKQAEIYNISSSDFRSNLEVTKYILAILEFPESRIEFVPDRLGHDFRYAINSTKVRQELSWAPVIEFEKGIQATVNWYMKNLEFLSKKGSSHDKN
jgi:dTDP-glucose 4,6-dehydratase